MSFAPLDEKEIHEAQSEGYSEMIFPLPAESRDVVLQKLDEVAAFAEKVKR